MLIGFATYGALYNIALSAYLRKASDVSWNDLKSVIPIYATISELIGGVIMAGGVVSSWMYANY